MKPSMALAVWLVGFAVMPACCAPVPMADLVAERRSTRDVALAGSADHAIDPPSGTADEMTADRVSTLEERSPRAKLKNNSLAHARDVSNAGGPTVASDELD
ncbi:hypothetical protein HDZ31DRAFT_62115 [Schizophyllum fasciatum]